MKNFLTNKSLRNVRGILTGLFMAMLFGALLSPIGSGVGELAFGLSFIGGVAIAAGYTKSERNAMAFACGSISAGLSLDCNKKLTSGVYATVYLANRADIDFDAVTYNSSNGRIVEDIAMLATKSFYTFEGKLSSTEPAWRSIKGKYDTTFEHELKLRLFDITGATLKQVEQMAQGDLVAIVRNNFDGTVAGNCRYDILGLGAGLKCELAERVYSSTDDNGAITVTLKTAEYARESGPAHRLFITDAAATEALLATLL